MLCPNVDEKIRELRQNFHEGAFADRRRRKRNRLRNRGIPTTVNPITAREFCDIIPKGFNCHSRSLLRHSRFRGNGGQKNRRRRRDSRPRQPNVNTP